MSFAFGSVHVGVRQRTKMFANIPKLGKVPLLDS